MDLHDAVINRRSVRKFSSIRPPDDILLKIIDLARWAPSHCNTQNSYFIIIDEEKIKQQIVNMGGSVIIKNAPVGVLVLYDNCSDNQEYLDHIQSGSAIIQNFLLCAYAEGLATCWIAHLPKKGDLRKILRIPNTFDPIAYILVGYPEKEIREVPRKYDLKDIIGNNVFSNNNRILNQESKSLSLKRFFRTIYYRLPTCFKRLLNPIVDRLFVKKFDN